MSTTLIHEPQKMKRIDEYISKKIAGLSFVCSCMIVFLHSYTTGIVNGKTPPYLSTNTFVQEFISQGVTRVAVPFFFLVFGFLLFRDFEFSLQWTKRKWVSRFWSLCVPYMVWCCLGIAFVYILKLLYYLALHSESALGRFDFSDVRWWMGIFGIGSFPRQMYHLWFVQTLLVYVFCSPLLGILAQRLKLIIPLLGLVMFFLPCIPHCVNTSFLLTASGAYIALCTDWNGRCETKPFWTLIVCVAWMGLCALKAWLTLVGANPYLTYYMGQLGVLTGISALWISYDYWGQWLTRVRKFFAFSFFIYCCHFPLFAYIAIPIKRLISDNNLFLYLVVPCINITVCILAASCLRRYSPKLYGVLSGRR